MSISVLITPPPTPNGPLHLGHLSGPYVAGDVTVRAARTRGESVLSVSGLDVHQNYVVTAAEQEGRTPAEVIEDYGAARIRSAFALAVPARVRDLFDRLLAEGLPDVPLAYPTDWGIPSPGGTRIDVWVEMALGYLHAVPRRLGHPEHDAEQVGQHAEAHHREPAQEQWRLPLPAEQRDQVAAAASPRIGLVDRLRNSRNRPIAVPGRQ